MKILQTIARIFTGMVFVFSGFVKAIDPQGSAIKFEEYFFAFHIDFLSFTALPLAIILSSLELVIGINLISAVRLKLTSWFLIVFMAFFTVLTFILALTNPVSDCGCFGDAIKLTNWQTFWKNIIILVPAIFVFLRKEKFKPLYRSVFEWFLAGFGFLFAIILSIYCIIHLPLIDFRPYHTGANIPDKMVLPEGAPVDQYETILIYEKDGVQQEFNSTNYPWQDTTWHWVETRQKLISKGEVPPIHDFSITSFENGEEITDRILSSPSYVFLLIAPNLDKANKRYMEEANDMARHAGELDMEFICLTSSTDNQIIAFQEAYHPAYDFYTMDETTIKTIIRANPGLVILQEGTVIGKWNYRDAPKPDNMNIHVAAMAISAYNQQLEMIKVLFLLLGFVLLFGWFVYNEQKA